jgi:hypothetical protein
MGRALCAAILTIAFSGEASRALPAERPVLELYAEYPTLGIPAVTSALNLANIFEFDRVFVDGADVGAFDFNKNIMFDVPSGAKTMQLRQRQNQPWNWGKTRPASNVVDISKIYTGRVLVSCHLGLPNPHLGGLPDMDSMSCRVTNWGKAS